MYNLKAMNVKSLTPLQEHFVHYYVGDKPMLVHKKTGEVYDESKPGVNTDDYELIKAEHTMLIDVICTAETGERYVVASQNSC